MPSELEDFLEMTNFDTCEFQRSKPIIRIRNYVCPKGPIEPDPMIFVKALLDSDPIPFVDLPRCSFNDHGVYTIQFHGKFYLYEPIASTEYDIYAGSTGTSLSKRLQQHYKTIKNAESTLNLADFSFRILPLKWLYQSVETELIARLDPTWNKAGFGHRPGGDPTRVEGNIPEWHTLHPGGAKAGKSRDLRDVEAAFKKAVQENKTACNATRRKLGLGV